MQAAAHFGLQIARRGAFRPRSGFSAPAARRGVLPGAAQRRALNPGFQGLRAGDIPVEGRIAALCDVFDALTSERPDKRAWSVEEALAYVDGNAGLHFEPGLVTVFKEILPEILVIRQRFSDEAPLPPEAIADVA